MSEKKPFEPTPSIGRNTDTGKPEPLPENPTLEELTIEKEGKTRRIRTEPTNIRPEFLITNPEDLESEEDTLPEAEIVPDDTQTEPIPVEADETLRHQKLFDEALTKEKIRREQDPFSVVTPHPDDTEITILEDEPLTNESDKE